MAKPRKMTEDELAGAVKRMLADATLDSGSRATFRDEALKFARGEVDFPPAGPNRSKVVSRDVADYLGLVMPGLTRVFFSADALAIFEPTRREHEAYASQATDIVNYVVLRESNGYRHLRDAMEDACLLGNGIVKHWWDHSTQYDVSMHSGQTDEQYKFLLQGQGVEELEHTEYPDPDFVMPEVAPEVLAAIQAAPPEELQANGIDPAMYAPRMLHDVKIRRVVSSGRLRLSAVPDEEFIIDRNAKVLDEECRFVAHGPQRKTRTQLIKEGYSRAKVEEIPTYETRIDTTERRDPESDDNELSEAPDNSTELVEVYECYILIDFNGDGMAERRRVVVAGGAEARTILANEEWEDDLPFSDIVPDPRPHTRRGRGLYEDLKDVQRVKTVVLRGIIDNSYQVINPQQVVDTNMLDDGAIDEVVSPQFGGIIRGRAGAVTPLEIPHIGPELAPVLDYMDQVAEKRTGISQRSQALDMDALQNQSATAVNAAMSAAHSKVEEYARNIAEFGGLKRIFASCLKLIVKHQDRARTIRLRGKLVEVDPRAWDAGMDVTINVGLGTGSRDRDLATINIIAAKQEQVVMRMGPFNEHLNIGHLFETYRKLAEAAALKNADSYFPEISQEQVAAIRQQMANQPPPPDPKMVEAQNRAQIEQMKAQTNAALQAQKNASDAALARQKAEFEARTQVEKQNAELAMQERENALQIELQRQVQDAKLIFLKREGELKAQLRLYEMEREFELTREANMMNAANQARQADTNIRGAE